MCGQNVARYTRVHVVLGTTISPESGEIGGGGGGAKRVFVPAIEIVIFPVR